MRKAHTVDCFFRGADLNLSVWDNDTVEEEVLGEEDTYRLGELPPLASVIDLGANVGTFTLAMLMKDCHVLAVEADLDSLLLLKRNVGKNKTYIPKGAKCFPVCACVCGDLPLQKFSWKGPESLSPPIEVSAKLWDYLPSDRPRVVKLDIEESEIELFKDPRSVGFFSMAQHVLMEWHCYDGHIYREALEAMGFAVELTGCGNPAPPYDLSFARGMLYARK